MVESLGWYFIIACVAEALVLITCAQCSMSRTINLAQPIRFSLSQSAQDPQYVCWCSAGEATTPTHHPLYMFLYSGHSISHSLPQLLSGALFSFFFWGGLKLNQPKRDALFRPWPLGISATYRTSQNCARTVAEFPICRAGAQNELREASSEVSTDHVHVLKGFVLMSFPGVNGNRFHYWTYSPFFPGGEKAHGRSVCHQHSSQGSSGQYLPYSCYMVVKRFAWHIEHMGAYHIAHVMGHLSNSQAEHGEATYCKCPR